MSELSPCLLGTELTARPAVPRREAQELAQGCWVPALAARSPHVRPGPQPPVP